MKIVALLLFLTAPCFAAEFNRAALVGVRLELADEKRVAIYTFTDAGDAIATIGIKDGPLAGPVFQWKIEKGKLCIFDDTWMSIYTLEEEKTDRILVHDDKGAKLVFYRTKKK